MATRCNVKIVDNKGNEHIMYHHYDGYPDGVGADLNKIIKSYNDFESVDDCAEYITSADSSFEPNDAIHGDIEYLYTINIDNKTISCQSIDWKSGEVKADVYCVEFGSTENFEGLY